MKLLGRTQPLSRYPIGECLSVIHRLGFDGVELCLENPDLAPGLLTPEMVGAVRAQVAALGLQPCSVSYHRDYIYDDAEFELTRQAIRWTPQFGADVFVFSGTQRRSGDGGSETRPEWNRMVRRTVELVEIAQAQGVVLALEFEPGFVVGSTADLLRLFEAIPSPHLAANLDLGHLFLCDPDPLQAIRQVGARVVHCHIENMRAGVHDHLIPQEGDMELGAYLAALADTGFAGGLALDLYKYDYEAVAEQAVAYLRRLLRAATPRRE
jgi:sugar phosphate isomerase/epimerase